MQLIKIKSFSCIGNNDENVDANVNNDLGLDLYQSLAEKITKMGFTHQQAVDALKNNECEIEKAVSSLL